MISHYHLTRAKEEVISCIEIWSDILKDHFLDKIEYAYVKGSAVKEWDSPIDYVPVLSDIDIHIKLVKGKKLFSNSEAALNQAVKITEIVENEYYKRNPKFYHLPRIQITILNEILKDPNFILPHDLSDVLTILGDPETKNYTLEELKKTDLKHLLELEDVLHNLPQASIDRFNLDWWVLIRRLSWRVSPTPIRLLTQFGVNPIDVWKWNRTKVCKELKEKKFFDVAEHYNEYYLLGWKMFFTKFQNFQIMRNVVISAYNVLKTSIFSLKLAN